MRTNKTIIELLQVTKENTYGKRTFYALQDLHNEYGFDFCKPYIAETHNGSFTQKSIAKDLSINYRDYTVIVIMYRYGAYNVAKLEETTVSLTRCNAFDTLSSFYSKTDFNDARKQAEKVYIIAQKKEFLTKSRPRFCGRYKEVTLDTRYASYDDTPCRIYEKRLPKIYENAIDYMYDLDKSGYPVYLKRSKLQEKASVIRRERKKAEYNAMTNTRDMIEKARVAIEEKKKEVAQALLNATTYDDIEKIENCLSRWRGLGSAIYDLKKVEEREAEKSFYSPENFNSCISDIYKALNNIAF